MTNILQAVGNRHHKQPANDFTTMREKRVERAATTAQKHIPFAYIANLWEKSVGEEAVGDWLPGFRRPIMLTFYAVLCVVVCCKAKLLSIETGEKSAGG